MAEGIKPFRKIDWFIAGAGALFIEESFFDLLWSNEVPFFADIAQFVAGAYLVSDRIGKSRGWRMPWD